MKEIPVYFALLGAGLILAGCTSNIPKATDMEIADDSSIETDNKKAGNSNPTKIVTANNAITWSTSDTSSNNRQAQPKADVPAKPNLSGSWILNKNLSDNPQEKIKETMKQARSSKGGSRSSTGGFEPSGGRRGGGMKGSGGRRGRKGDTSSDDQGGKSDGQDSAFRELQALLSVSETLVLTHEDPMLLIVTNNGEKQRIFTDNRGSSVSANSATQQKVTTAGWEKGILVVEITSNSGPQLIQRYRLITDPHKLLVSTVMLHPKLPKALLINRVYEPAKVRTDKSKTTILSTGH